MKRQMILSTALASTFLFSSVSALSLWTSTCNYFGISGCASSESPSQNIGTSPQAFSFENFFNNLPKWNISRFNANTNNEQIFPTTQLGQTPFSPGIVQTNDKNTPNTNDFGILGPKTNTNPLLDLEKIAERKAVFECSINPSANCMSKVAQQNSLTTSSSTQKTDEYGDPLTGGYGSSGPEAVYSPNYSAQTPYYIPELNTYSSQQHSPHSSNGAGYSTYQSLSPIDVAVICKNAKSGKGNLVLRAGVTFYDEKGQFIMDKNLLGSAQAASAIVGKPITIVSAYRSQAKQNSICAGGGTGAKACGNASQHTFGKAVDIAVKGFSDNEKIMITLVMMSGGWSVGNYPGESHIHYGADGGPVTWRHWYTGLSAPPLYMQKAFYEAGVNWNNKTAPRSQVVEGAKKALQRLCQ